MTEREPPRNAGTASDQVECTHDDRKETERVRRVLEDARQRVKPIVKRELEGEIVGADLLNFRLKNAR